jgi:hypothetical protein
MRLNRVPVQSELYREALLLDRIRNFIIVVGVAVSTTSNT